LTRSIYLVGRIGNPSHQAGREKKSCVPALDIQPVTGFGPVLRSFSTMAVADFFLKVDGVTGESQDAKHKDEIEVLGWSWSEQQPNITATGAAGKVSMADFHFSMSVNTASVRMALMCATGQNVKSAVLTCRKAGKEPQEYLIITLSNVMVSSFQSGASASSNVVPVDQFTLSYDKIEWQYRRQLPDGTLGPPVKVGFNLPSHSRI
jgi:type VI secretion system secreted protein Hcp